MSNVKLRKLLSKRVLATVTVVITGLIVLTGCGDKIPNGYYKLNSVSETGDNSFGTIDENSYVVFNDGKGYIVLKGTPEDITYDAETGIAHTAFGDIPATVDGDNFIMADKNFKMKFALSNDRVPVKPDYPTPPEPEAVEPEEAEEEPVEEEAAVEEAEPVEEEAALSEAMSDYWNGYWFGYWTVDPIENVWKDHVDHKFYVLARSSIDDDGYTEIHIWDNEYAVADAYGYNDLSAESELGTFVSTKGVFWDGDDMMPGDWTIDPATAGHDDTMVITGTCLYDLIPQFNYTITLVKWGCDWSGFAEDEQPEIMAWYTEQMTKSPLTLKLPEKYETEPAEEE